MIVVRVELWSAITGAKHTLAEAYIANDGTGGASTGNYDAKFWKGDAPRGRAWAQIKGHREGRVERYPRKAVAVWNLVRRAIEAAGYTK